MKKIVIILFCLFICFVIYNETTREKFAKNNTKEVVIDTKQLNNILDSVNNSQDSVALAIDKLSSDNEKHSIKNKKLKDSVNRLNKERKHLINKVQILEIEKSRQMIVQKTDTISEK